MSGHPADGAARKAAPGRTAPSPEQETAELGEEPASPPQMASWPPPSDWPQRSDWPQLPDWSEAASGPPVGLLADIRRVIAERTRDLALSASALTGICLALAVCGAGWFTAGTRSGNVSAVAALWASYLAALAARSLARAGIRARWLAGLGWALAEVLCYAGMAGGAAADQWPGAWTLAISVISLIAVGDLMAASSGPAGMTLSQGGLAWRCVHLLLSMPSGGRILLAGVIALGSGTPAALFWLLYWSLMAIGYKLATRSRPTLGQEARPLAHGPAPRIPWSGSPVLLLSASGEELAPPPPAGHRILPLQHTDPMMLSAPVLEPASVQPARPGPDGRGSPVHGELVQRLRDDGELARRLGRLVRGNLLPLPPAVVGLVATATLAFLGLRGLPAYLLLAPALITVLLAAPGSSNPHTGRLDWLVPPVLLGWQLLYLAAMGKAVGVPGPAIFALGTALLLRYADLACQGRPVLVAHRFLTASRASLAQPGSELGTALGWEGRTLVLGLAGAVGIGVYAYVAMSVYVIGLIGAKVVATRPGAAGLARPRAVRIRIGPAACRTA